MEKKSFKIVKAEAEAKRHNSNLENLASASNMITEEMDRLKTAMDNLVKLQAEIDEAGENPDTLTFEKTRALYNRVFEKKYGGRN